MRIIALVFAFLLVVVSADAQKRRGKPKVRPERPSTEEKAPEEEQDGVRIIRSSDDGVRAQQAADRGIIDDLWFGAGLQLSFSGFNGQNALRFGISPMVGYKVTDWLSVGPRIEYQYFSQRFQASPGDILRFNFSSVGAGAFTRVQFLEQFFLHAEYQILSTESLDQRNWTIVGDQINSIRVSQNFGFVGAGMYTGGFGSLGSAFYVLYDVIEEEETSNLPLYFRFEINYNF